MPTIYRTRLQKSTVSTNTRSDDSLAKYAEDVARHEFGKFGRRGWVPPHHRDFEDRTDPSWNWQRLDGVAARVTGAGGTR